QGATTHATMKRANVVRMQREWVARSILFCLCPNTLIYEAGPILHFYLLFLRTLFALAHL
ncbi:MAG: hypothetical protein WCA25_12430, partial [Pseudolabrys sp.]